MDSHPGLLEDMSSCIARKPYVLYYCYINYIILKVSLFTSVLDDTLLEASDFKHRRLYTSLHAYPSCGQYKEHFLFSLKHVNLVFDILFKYFHI